MEPSLDRGFNYSHALPEDDLFRAYLALFITRGSAVVIS